MRFTERNTHEPLFKHRSVQRLVSFCLTLLSGQLNASGSLVNALALVKNLPAVQSNHYEFSFWSSFEQNFQTEEKYS